MRRWFYFFLERLNITPGERRLVTVTMVIFIITSATDSIIQPKFPFDSSYYAPLEKEFKKHVKLARQKDSLRKVTYYTVQKPAENKVRPKAFHHNKSRNLNAAKSSKKRNKKSLKRHSIDINTANKKTLMLLPGIGPKTAKKIIVYRKEHGSFSTITSIMRVKGIGTKKLKKIKPFLRLKKP